MTKTIYLAGGCFWGVEKLFSQIRGVVSTTAGYCNGNEAYASLSYEQVCKDNTGYKETVKIEYDSDTVSLEKLLKAYFAVIDPTQQNAQAHDVGEQYQTGVFYSTEDDYKTAKKVFAWESEKHVVFCVLLQKMKNFFTAEEYHQHYLDKNPLGYCHISFDKMNKVVKEINGDKD